MKKLLMTLVFVAFTTQLTIGQNYNSESPTNSDYELGNQEMVFTIQTGIWQPLGKLDQTFDLNPNFAFKFGLPVFNNWLLQAGASINIPINSEPFDYILDESVYVTKSKYTVNGVLGLWLSQEKRLNYRFLFDKYFGIGLGFIQTDIENPDSLNGYDKFYGVETVNLNVGVAIRTIEFKKKSIGLFIEYNHAPYALFGKVHPSFGNSSIVAGTMYNF